MADLLTFAALLVLLCVAAGLLRILWGPAEADRLMAAQLLGSGTVGVTLLLAFATAQPALVDIALTLAVLAAFASVAFSIKASVAGKEGEEG